MIDPELQDLLPLYLSEARRRLEQLAELAVDLAEPTARGQARRELHTLKGSSRMLKLGRVAELCHRGEGLLENNAKAGGELGAEDGESGLRAAFTALLDEIEAHLDHLADHGTGGPAASSQEASRSPSDGPAARATETTETAEHRVAATTVDRLTGDLAVIRLEALAGLAVVERLGELAQLAESGVAAPLPRQNLAMLANRLRELGHDLEGHHRRLLQRAEGQLGRLLDFQLQPLRPFLLSLARHARELARELGKEIVVDIEGGEARLDQRITGEVRNAFLHLVRNAVDHGIESPERRRELGKEPAGHLRLEASSTGERVEIVVADDGAGIDTDEVWKYARERGLVSAEAGEPGAAAILQLLFTPGFSTRHQVSDVSGRGVGLDVVAQSIRQLGGEVWIESALGRGSTLHVEVPAAQRGEKVLILRCEDERLALPKSAVRWVKAAVPGDLAESAEGSLMTVEGTSQRVISLARLVGAVEPPHPPVLIALRLGGGVIAAPEVEGEAEVLIRPFVRSVAVPSYFSGLALLPTGEPVAVLSPRGLAGQALPQAPRPRPQAPTRRLRILLVEDSLVTREMERRMLEDEGFRVTAVSSADEALGLLAEESYDCLVTDLEMPEMDGLELTQRVRSMERWAHLPIVMVTTRDDARDRLAGLEAGADAYLSKQALESRRLGQLLRRLGTGS